ncbi:MAG: hypothetical protein ACOYM2_11490 [Rectinemataceae bacterium]
MSMPEGFCLVADPGRMEEAEGLRGELMGAGIPCPACVSAEEKSSLTALLQRRSTVFIFPLSEGKSGTLQGMLEFLDLPFAGPALAGFVAGADPDFRSAIVGSSSIADELPEARRRYLAVAGNEEPRAGLPVTARGEPLPMSKDEEGSLVEFALSCYRDLRLEGFSLLAIATEGGRARLLDVDPEPSFLPRSPFRQSMEAAGMDFTHWLRDSVDLGMARHRRDSGLSHRYRDGV